MNAEQYKIVKAFLAMGNSPQRIAKEFKAKLGDVAKVARTATYKQYQNADPTDPMDMFNEMFGRNI